MYMESKQYLHILSSWYNIVLIWFHINTTIQLQYTRNNKAYDQLFVSTKLQ